jgi:ATP-dependent Clp protease protease subunit
MGPPARVDETETAVRHVLRSDHYRWQPAPDRSPEPWQPSPTPGGDLPGWLAERLFEQRTVMLRGPLTGAVATQTAAALLTLDGLNADPVQVHLASSDGELPAAFAVVDAIDAMRAPVHVLVTSQTGGAAVAVLAAADRRSAYPHASLRLAEPRAAAVTGTADEVAAAAGRHLRELEEVIVRLAEVTGQPRSRVEDDLSVGRTMSAAEAVEYGLLQEVVGRKPA